MTKDLSRILSPKSIAVIGASRKEGSVGQAIFKNLLKGEFNGVLYPVNPHTSAIDGIKVYSSLASIKDSIDLAILVVPADMAPAVLQECGAAHIPFATIISSGFKDVGGQGNEREAAIKNVAEKHNILLIGPNSFGLINTDPVVQMNASLAPDLPKAGNIAVLSQSGTLGKAVLDAARKRGVGISKFVSLGNKGGANELDFLQLLREDPLTDVILLYLEEFTDGVEFLRLPKPKPILALKAGQPQDTLAPSFYSGALAQSDKAFDDIFLQAGVLRVESIHDLLDYALAFSTQPLVKGNRIALVTNSTGPGDVAREALRRHNFTLAPLELETKQVLRDNGPVEAKVDNPIEMVGEATANQILDAIKGVLKDPMVDAVLSILKPQSNLTQEQAGQTMAYAAESMKISPWTAKTLVGSIQSLSKDQAGLPLMEKAGVPHYPFPEEAVRTLAAMKAYHDKQESRKKDHRKHYPTERNVVEKILNRVRKENREFLPQWEALKVFKAYGIPVLNSNLVSNEQEAMQTAETMGYPVVCKISSPSLVHKRDVAGVKVNLKNKDEVLASFRALTNVAETYASKENIWGVEIQPMTQEGLKLFVGVTSLANFGPVVVCGLGGNSVHVIRDVSFRSVPLHEGDIIEMISNLNVDTPFDIQKTEEILGRTSQLALDFPEIQELDMNSLVVYAKGQGAFVTDGRILLKKA